MLKFSMFLLSGIFMRPT